MWEGSVSGRRWRENGFDNVTDAGVGVGVGREWWGEEMGALIETHYLCEEVMEQQSRRNEQTWRVRLRAVHALMELERIAEAEQLCVATLTDMVEGPADLTLVARAQTELAKVLAKERRFEESLECYVRAAELYGDEEHLAPAEMFRLARLRASMGLVHERMGAMEEALQQYRQALSLFQAQLGMNHSRVGGVLVALGGACQRVQRWREAVGYYVRARAVFRQALGPEHLLLVQVCCEFVCSSV